jgi:hypothetical protein
MIVCAPPTSQLRVGARQTARRQPPQRRKCQQVSIWVKHPIAPRAGEWLGGGMKRIILSLAMGLLLINLTSGCNKSSDATTPATDTNVAPSTNSAATNAPH